MTLPHLLRAVVVATLLAGAPATAFAQTSADKAAVDAAKAGGAAGEQADGYIGLVSGGDPALRSAVAAINTGRTAAYRQAASASGVPPQAAAEIAARQLQARTPPGQFIRTTSGAWERK